MLAPRRVHTWYSSWNPHSSPNPHDAPVFGWADWTLKAWEGNRFGNNQKKLKERIIWNKQVQLKRIDQSPRTPRWKPKLMNYMLAVWTRWRQKHDLHPTSRPRVQLNSSKPATLRISLSLKWASPNDLDKIFLFYLRSMMSASFYCKVWPLRRTGKCLPCWYLDELRTQKHDNNFGKIGISNRKQIEARCPDCTASELALNLCWPHHWSHHRSWPGPAVYGASRGWQYPPSSVKVNTVPVAKGLHHTGNLLTHLTWKSLSSGAESLNQQKNPRNPPGRTFQSSLKRPSRQLSVSWK